MKNKFNIFLIAFCLWFGFFAGNYVIFGVGFYPPLFLSILGYLIYLKKMVIPRYAMVFFSIALSYILLFLMSHLYNGFSIEIFAIEFRYILKAFFIPIGVSLLSMHLFKKYSIKNEQISLIVFIIIFLQAILAVFQLTNISFREWFFSFLTLAEGWQYFVRIGHFRTIGLAGLSIYDTSIAYSLLFGLTVYLYKLQGYNYNFQWIVGWSAFFLLIILSGRTGLILFLLLTIFILINNLKKYSLLNFTIVSFVLFCLLIYFIDYEYLSIFINFAFELFTNDSGRIESASTNDLLKNHLFLPLNVNPFFGDAIWAQPSLAKELNYIYKTDSGYILSFISMGIFGLLVSFFMTYIIFKGYKIAYFGHFKNTHINTIFKIIVFLFIIGIILKGPIFFSDKFMPVLIFVFMVQHYIKGISKIEKININSNL